MEVSATTSAPRETGADTVAVALFEDERPPHDPDGALGALLDSGEAQARPRHLAHVHVDGRRWVLVGCGSRSDFDVERARQVAGAVVVRARELGTRTLAWEVPHHVAPSVAGALVDGTLGAAYRFERLRSEPDEERRGPDALIVCAHDDLGPVVSAAAVVGRAVNTARDLQNEPGNELTPTRLAAHAEALADELEGISVEVLGREELVQRGMGAFSAVAQGSYQEPRLISLCYDGHPSPAGPTLGWVGKAVTFDSGGISLKPGAKMSEMKFDMSGGAAVLGAVEAVARLAMPVRVLAVIGATENLPSGRSVKPGDVVRAGNGTTIEVINTDAEGRLVLADCLAYAVAQGVDSLVDLATLTGAIVTTFGSTYAGLMGRGEEWLDALAAASQASGEELWRLPLHDDYDELIKGTVADILNAVETRKAGSITAAQFLARFTGELPWAHVDIAGVAYERGRAYAPKGGSGFGVRLLVELARGVAAGTPPGPRPDRPPAAS